MRQAGGFFLALAGGYLDEHDDASEAISAFFDGAAETLVATDYADACPIDTAAAEKLASAVLAALEGAFVLCRAKRTTAPLNAARDLAVGAVERALADRSTPVSGA